MSEVKGISEERGWTKQVVKEYREHRNPPIAEDIDVVWVLSGHGTYDTQSPHFPNLNQPYANNDESFKFEDYERISFGIELVKRITAQRLNKDQSKVTKEDITQYGPVLLYNGDAAQNQNLKEAAEKEDFPIPQEKLRVEAPSEELDPAKVNTRTQFEKFPADLLEDLVAKKKKVAIVTSLYHLSRVARTANGPKILQIQPLFKDLKILFFAADKPKDQLPKDVKSVTKRAVEIRRNVSGEGKRITTYSQKGDISENRRTN